MDGLDLVSKDGVCDLIYLLVLYSVQWRITGRRIIITLPVCGIYMVQHLKRREHSFLTQYAKSEEVVAIA